MFRKRLFIIIILIFTAVLFTCFQYCLVSYHIMKTTTYSLCYTLVSFVPVEVFFVHNKKILFQMHHFCYCEQTIFKV